MLKFVSLQVGSMGELHAVLRMCVVTGLRRFTSAQFLIGPGPS